MGLLYNYSYLNANGYLQKFRDALGAPKLDRATLTKILKIYNDRHKLKGFIVPPEPGAPSCLYYKDTLNNLLGIDRTGYEVMKRESNWKLREIEDILHGIEAKELFGNSKKCADEYGPSDCPSPEEDMEYVSNQMANLEEREKKTKRIIITESQMKKIMEYSFVNREPQYKKVLSITYSVIPPREEGDDTTFLVKKFEDYEDGYYTDFNEECDFDDLISYFGRDIANAILDRKGEKDADGNFVLDLNTEKNVDTSDVNAVNEYAKWQYGTTYDFRIAGYLLTDGTMLDFSGGGTGRQYGTRGLDHRNMSINGVDMNKFISLGNIRLMPEMPGFEICRKPTEQQVRVLQQFIRRMGAKGYLVVDVMDESGRDTFSKEYEPSEYGKIISDVEAHIASGGKVPSYRSEFADFIQENKMKGKKIIMTESQFSELKKRLAENYFVETNKVEIVKEYLDDNFVRGGLPVFGEDGYPSTVPVVGMKMTDGSIGRNMTAKQLFYLLQDKFNKIYEDPKQRDSFLKKVLVDWYYKRIKNGLLSRNNY